MKEDELQKKRDTYQVQIRNTHRDGLFKAKRAHFMNQPSTSNDNDDIKQQFGVIEGASSEKDVVGALETLKKCVKKD